MDPTALLFLMELPNPPTRPPVVEERLALSKTGEKIQKIAERSVRGFQTYIEDWSRRLVEAKAKYDSLPLVSLGQADAARLDELVEELEGLADARAREIAQFKKRIARDLKRFGRVRDPSVSAVMRDTARKLLVLDERVLAELLDYALFVRAVRAERTPDNGPLHQFSDASEMRGFLRHNAV